MQTISKIKIGEKDPDFRPLATQIADAIDMSLGIRKYYQGDMDIKGEFESLKDPVAMLEVQRYWEGPDLYDYRYMVQVTAIYDFDKDTDEEFEIETNLTKLSEKITEILNKEE